MKARKIKDVLFDYLEGSDFKEVNETISIETSWKSLVGKTISKNTEIVSFKKGTLTIKTSNPIWRNELIFQKEDLLKRLKKEEPELNIKEIDFR